MTSTFDAIPPRAAIGDGMGVDPNIIIVGGGGGVRKRSPSNNDNNSNNNNNNNGGGYTCNNNIVVHHGRRQRRNELQYDAYAAHDELALRRRLGRSSLVDDVDRDRDCDGDEDVGCRVVSSMEYPDETTEPRHDDDHVGRKRTRDDDHDDGYNLATYYMIAGLLESSRHHYHFEASAHDAYPASNDDHASSSSSPTMDDDESPSPAKRHGRTIAVAGIDGARDDDGRPAHHCEDHSEGLSTWTPSSSYLRTGTYRRERDDGPGGNVHDCNIDNDNRSDGQSSDMAFGGCGGSSSASSSTSSSSHSDCSSEGCIEGYGIIHDDDDDDDNIMRIATTTTTKMMTTKMMTNDVTTTDDKYIGHDYDGPYSVIG